MKNSQITDSGRKGARGALILFLLVLAGCQLDIAVEG